MSTDTSSDRAVPIGALLRRGLPLALICAAACAVIAGLLSSSRPDQYEARTLVLLRQSNLDPSLGSGDNGQDEGEGIGTEAVLVGRRGVLRRVANRPDVTLSPDELEDRIGVDPLGGTNVIAITATGDTGTEAASIANAVGSEFVKSRQEGTQRRARRTRVLLARQLRRLSDDTRESITGVQLRERIDELRILEQLGSLTPQVSESAEVPTDPFEPTPRRDATLGGLFGLLLGGGIAVLWVASDRRVRRPDEVGELLGVPVLATMRRRLGRGRSHAADDEPMRLLHLSLRHLREREAPSTVAVTPLEASEGAVAVARGLAEAAAAAGERTLLVTAELDRHDGIAEADEDGLRAVLVRGAALDESVTAVRGRDEEGDQGGSSYDLLGSHGARVDLARTPRLRELLAEASERYSLVVLDAPSPLEHSEAVPLLAGAEAVVIVALGTPDRQRAEALRARLHALRARPVGVVVRA